MADDVEQAIDEALAGKPRASEIAQMVAALEARRDTYVRERDAAGDPEVRKAWSTRVAEAERQIRVLREEEAITDFVERSVRVAANRPRLAEDDDPAG